MVLKILVVSKQKTKGKRQMKKTAHFLQRKSDIEDIVAAAILSKIGFNIQKIPLTDKVSVSEGKIYIGMGVHQPENFLFDVNKKDKSLIFVIFNHFKTEFINSFCFEGTNENLKKQLSFSFIKFFLSLKGQKNLLKKKDNFQIVLGSIPGLLELENDFMYATNMMVEMFTIIVEDFFQKNKLKTAIYRNIIEKKEEILNTGVFNCDMIGPIKEVIFSLKKDKNNSELAEAINFFSYPSEEDENFVKIRKYSPDLKNPIYFSEDDIKEMNLNFNPLKLKFASKSLIVIQRDLIWEALSLLLNTSSEEKEVVINPDASEEVENEEVENEEDASEEVENEEDASEEVENEEDATPEE